MAKRASGFRVVTQRAPAPIIRIATPRAAPIARRPKHRRRVGGGSRAGLAGFFSKQRQGAFAGAFALGILDKQGTALPTVPVLGRAGTAALAAYFMGFHDAATGLGSIALYEFAREGKIAGDFSTV